MATQLNQERISNDVRAARTISKREVSKTLTIRRSIQLARQAYLERARKNVLEPLRTWFALPNGTSFYFMPAHVNSLRTVSIKVVSVNLRNPKMSLPSTMARIYVYDSKTGLELARLAGDDLTAIRTAASSALATDLLAPEETDVLGIIGTGKQAQAHVPAMVEVRDFSRILVYSRSRSHRDSFVRKISRATRIPVIAVPSANKLARESDIVVIATSSSVPVLNGRAVRPGTHVNAIGASLPGSREMDTLLVKRSILIVDSIEQALTTYGDVLIPLQEKAIERSHLRAELGELLLHRRAIKRKKKDITVFKAGGLGVLDAVFADYVVSHGASAH